MHARPRPWPQVWALSAAAADGAGGASDGVEAWRSACAAPGEPAAGGGDPRDEPASELADEALAEWLRCFARGT